MTQVVLVLVHEDVLCLGKFVHKFLVLETCLDDRLKFLVVFVQLDIFLHVSYDLRVGKLVLKLIVFVLESQDLVY